MSALRLPGTPWLPYGIPQSYKGYRLAYHKGRGGYRKPRRAKYGIRGFQAIEKKFYDTFLIGASITAPTDVTGGEHNPSATICLNSVTQGDGESQRDGRHITNTSIEIEGIFQLPAQINQTAAELASTVFFALV